jgi:hypothetical protein
MISLKTILTQLRKYLQTKRDKKRILNSGYFDKDYYLRAHPDVAQSMYSPIDHYLIFGGKEGRRTSEKFDTHFYVDQYSDVFLSGLNPLIHYLTVGQKENRICINPIELKEMPHFRPPDNEPALIIPFGYPFSDYSPPGSVCVICHVYYIDLVEEIKAYLSHLPAGFDLFISTDTEEKRELIAIQFSSWQLGKVDIITFPNRGKDIAPFLLGWPGIFDEYEYVLHIHTKKSLYNTSLKKWREYLLSHLLGNRHIIQSIFEIFKMDKSIGMIAPKHFPPVLPSVGWGYNMRFIRTIGAGIGLALDRNSPVDFPSGSMFWARTEALKPLLGCGFSLSDFPDEEGQNDETLAHAIERMFFYSCESAGFTWCKVIQKKLATSMTKATPVFSAEDLPFLIQKNRGQLCKNSTTNNTIV